ncbi:PCAF (P300/CBP-associated factor) N-terminal domain [Nesidiocoris tenuis]|uniref:histone acetyltransferase n=1 Tax=Nesidiocoris tenuis TaxID=355587 RepID=A0ABN7B7E0_9HEMI|nr:PCAF (P300/CBP-associated factor) N-terminal domain [Nesidiocoris tenuis]
MSEAGPSSTVAKAEQPKEPQRLSRQEIIQFLQKRKAQVCGMQRERKLLKLAIHSGCQESPCNCTGWKAAQKTTVLASAPDPCQTCAHPLSQHTAHLSGLPDDELNRLLGMVVDTEYVYNRAHLESDVEVKNIYYNLFRCMKASIQQLKNPLIEECLGVPPFETPTIARGVSNFLCHRYNHLGEKEWQIMYSLAQTFANAVNQYIFESPSVHKLTASEEDVIPYRRNYTKWMVFCFVPTFCDSIRHYDVSNIFGRTMLRSAFKGLKKDLIDKLYTENDRLSPEERAKFLPHLPRLMDLLEEDIYSPNSPIWEKDFKVIYPVHLQALDRKRHESDKRTGSPKLLTDTAEAAAPTTPSTGTKRNCRDRRVNDTPGGSESKRTRYSEASAANLADDDSTADYPVELIKEIVAEIEQEEKLNRVGLNSLFKETIPLVERAKAAEEKGRIKIVLLGNSLTAPVPKQTMLWLLGLRTLFLRHLTSMPVDYITRLVFDPRHKTLALIKDNKPAGGICFRQFPSQGFSEVVFCAVNTSDQYKGYGAHLMNHLKEYHIKIKIYNLLTFADRDAIVYFKKQGFSQTVTLNPAVYNGFIKHYDGAIFMHCKINPKIIYTELSAVVRCQKEVLKRIIERQKETVGKVHPGLTCFKEGFKRSIPIESIPGIGKTGWKPVMRTTRVSRQQEETSESESLHKELDFVLTSIKKHKLAKPFAEPVNAIAERAPDYYERIKYPMDLKTMTERLKSGYYTTRRLFIADMLRIFNNCRTYNHPDTEIYMAACDLDRYFQTKMKENGLWDK